MTATPEKTIDIHAFQVAGDDVAPLFLDVLQLRPNALFPLAERTASYAPRSRVPSAELRATAADRDVRRACETLARPTLCLRMRTGGGQVPASEIWACHVHGRAEFVVAVPSFEGSILVQTFASADDYLAWWLDLVAARVEQPGRNFLPPPLPLEAFVYALHTVDAYRRSAYASQLAYRPTSEPTIGADEFGTSIVASLKSGDIRWLLPAFAILTPGLDLRGFDAASEHVDHLERLGFFTSGTEEGGRKVLVFGEAARTMGVEFFRTWTLGVGFEHAVLTSSGERVLHRGFLAPTALGNHLAIVGRDADGRATVNHQSFSAGELSDRMSQLLGEALDVRDADPSGGVVDRPAVAVAPAPALESLAAAPTPAPAGGIPAAAAPAGVRRFCVGCGAALAPASRFCNGCGATAPAATPAPAVVPAVVPAAPPRCAKCGADARPGMKFCVVCGAPAR